ELPANLLACRVEPGSGGLLEPLRCCMRILLPNGRRTAGRLIEDLSLQGSLALDVGDSLGNPPPVLLGREMRPAGARVGVHRVGGRELQASEGLALAPGAVLPGAVEPVPSERLALQEGPDSRDSRPVPQLLDQALLAAVRQHILEPPDLGGLLL